LCANQHLVAIKNGSKAFTLIGSELSTTPNEIYIGALIKWTNTISAESNRLTKNESFGFIFAFASVLTFDWNRVARWFVFKPKIPIWVNFGGPLNGKCWHII
jgi:hypothetical protein